MWTQKLNLVNYLWDWLINNIPVIINFINSSSATLLGLSYSSMPSMKNVIQKHNSKVMEGPEPTNNKTCSSWQKLDCPFNENCLSECLVYNTVVNTSITKPYYRTCDKSFKDSCNKHTSSFRSKSPQKSTEVSNCIWGLKENSENYIAIQIFA